MIRVCHKKRLTPKVKRNYYQKFRRKSPVNLPSTASIIGIMFLLSIVMPVAASVSFESSAPQIITRGDEFSVNSIDAQNGPAAIWIIGRDYFTIKAATTRDRKGSWILTLKPDDTEKIPAGKYAIVVQDPGPDGLLEIDRRVTENGNITIQNRGKSIADIGQPGLQGIDIGQVITILDEAGTLQGVDDTFSTFYFFVEDPSVQFDQITDPSKHLLNPQKTGDRIVISGSTNIGIGNTLRADIRNLAANAIVTSKLITVTQGSGLNCWTYILEAPGLPVGDYSVTIDWSKSNITNAGSAFFSVENTVLPTQIPSNPEPLNSLRPSTTADTPLPIIITISLVLVLAIIIFTTQRK